MFSDLNKAHNQDRIPVQLADAAHQEHTGLVAADHKALPDKVAGSQQDTHILNDNYCSNAWYRNRKTQPHYNNNDICILRILYHAVDNSEKMETILNCFKLKYLFLLVHVKPKILKYK